MRFFDVKDLQCSNEDWNSYYNIRYEHQKLYEENIGSDPLLSSDENLLYSSSENREIIAWNSGTRDKVHRFQLENSILHFVVKSPYVLVLPDDQNTYTVSNKCLTTCLCML